MAAEIQADYLSGKVVYFLLRNATGSVWNGSAFVAYATVDYTNYDIAATEQGTASGYYTADMPSVVAGVYYVVAKERIGGSPAESDITVGTGTIQWSGSAVTADTDTFQAKVGLIDDDGSGVDRYLVAFFKNAQPITSGITSPDIWVYRNTGADLIGTSGTPDSLTEIGSTQTFTLNESTDRVVSGAAYIARVRATIEGSTRTWLQWIGRDSSS